MLIQPTIDYLLRMKLFGLARAFEEQLNQPATQTLSFEERFGLLVEREWTYRENRHLTRRLKAAKLREAACLEEVDYRHKRGLHQAVLQSLASGHWLTHHQNIIIIGPTGSGKTYLACALAHQACRLGFSTRYTRIPKLLHELQMAKADGSYSRVLARLAKLPLLILDDWGLNPLQAAERHDLLEVLEDRYDRSSTLVTSQFPISTWHETIGEPTLADAILDRLVHQAHKITLKGESMRKTRSLLTQTDQDEV